MPDFTIPGVQVQNPLALLAQAGQIKAQQNELAEAPLRMQALQTQVQAQQQEAAARQALNQAYQGSVTKDASGNPTFDTDKLMQNLSTGPAAYKSPEVLEGITKFQKTRLDIQTAQTELQQKQADMIGGAAAAIKAAGYDPTLAHSLLDSLPQSPQLNQIRQQISNPQQLKTLVDSAIQNSDKQRTLGASETTAAARKETADAEAKKLAGSLDPNSPLYHPTAESVALGTAPGAAAIQQGEAALAGKKSAAEAAARQPYEMSLARQRQALSQGNPNAAAALLVNGDATLSELKARGATPDFIANTLNAAHKLSGGQYNAQSADAQFQVAKSPANVAFFGSAKSLTDKGGTLDQLQEAGKLIPQSQIPKLNSLEDWAKAATGNGPLAKYASVALGVADDYSKVMGGGQGSDTSRLQALNLIKANGSPDARAGAIEGIRGAVGSQLSSRIGSNPVLGRMYGSQQQTNAGAPKVGDTKTFPNGKVGKWDGQGYVAQ